MQLNWPKTNDYLRGSFHWPNILIPFFWRDGGIGVIMEGGELSDAIGKMFSYLGPEGLQVLSKASERKECM